MPTVGEILRSEREKQGLTIKDIEKGTSIRALYLKAIEEDNYAMIPGEVYLKGFIRNYANFVGLNGQELVTLYRESKSTNSQISEAAMKEELEEVSKPNSRVIHTSPKESNKWLKVGIATILILGGGYWFYSGTNAPPSEMSKPAPGTNAQTTPVPAAPGTTATQPTSPIAANPIVVSAKYSQECWTMVTADGKQIFEGIPGVGQSLTWEAQKKLTVKLGNAGAADLVYNGQSLGKLGAKGEVIVKSFTAP